VHPRAFHYHSANTLQEAAARLAEFGDGAKSLIPLALPINQTTTALLT